MPREARPYQGLRAGMVTRGVAGLVDAAVVLIAVAVGLLGVNGLSFALDPRNFRVVGASSTSPAAGPSWAAATGPA